MVDFQGVKNKYYIMRHGQSLANAEKVIVSSPKNGVRGYGLTKQGKIQAAYALAHFPGLDRDTIIYASDFLRTRQTAAIVGENLKIGRDIVLSKFLRERFFGDWELTVDDNYKKVWADDAKKISPPKHNVEPVESVLNRIFSCISDIEDKYRKKNILLVSHGDTLQIFLAFLKGWPPSRHREVNHLEVAQIRRAGS